MKNIKDLTHRPIITIYAIKQRNKIHRIGRITPSISKLSFTAKVESPSKTFINTVMEYKPPTNVAATKYGKEMEPVAFHAFTKYFRIHDKTTSVSVFLKMGLMLMLSFHS